ncbi:DUF4097 family beta strand repeat-containing protein [Micromonospora sp. URMC 106]|jgi:DUF4097 and DUF4098 domain-containing protein YvlB|uniref:DUF4097 family beta strand repeat-containing protein n=1 Tax=Micromonospora sp. URMC 106 TaxID=3423408 RepID=UPI003F1DACCF
MALHRTVATLAVAATLIVSAGCDNLSTRRLDFDSTEAARISTVRVLPGAGDITVRAIGAAGEARIKRVVRYDGAQPDATYEIKGAELVLDTDCGNGCSVSYDVTVPEGVSVKGETGSGDVDLSEVGPVEFRLGSGNIRVSGADGPVQAETGSGDVTVTGASGPVTVKTGSGNIGVDDVAATVTLQAGSGDIAGSRLSAGVDAEAGSGNITLDLAKPASARAHASSGDVTLAVPAGRYQVRSKAGGGETSLGVSHDPTASLVLDISTDGGDQTITQR